MKKVLLLVLTCGFVFLNMPIAQASFLEVYDTISFGSGDYGHAVGTFGRAGELKWSVKDKNGNDKDFTWASFCVERDAYISEGSEHTVTGLTNFADNAHKSSPDPDPLDDKTAWLFWSFTNQTLDGYNSADNNTNFEDETDLQALIWYLEGELTETQFNTYKAIDGKGSFIEDWTDDAETALADGWKNNGRVQVVNLGVHQDQLIVSPVPEPATMMLFGLGLLGLAGFGRKKIRK